MEVLSQMGYETRDVSLPALVRWLVVLFGLIIAATVGTKYLIYDRLLPDYSAQLSQPVLHQRRVPPFPQIQAEPKKDMMVYRGAEDDVLAGAAAMPNEKAGLSVSAAIDVLANTKGIAGVTGNRVTTGDQGTGSAPASREDVDAKLMQAGTKP
jgi:hypothetical protein